VGGGNVKLGSKNKSRIMGLKKALASFCLVPLCQDGRPLFWGNRKKKNAGSGPGKKQCGMESQPAKTKVRACKNVEKRDPLKKKQGWEEAHGPALGLKGVGKGWQALT